MKASTQMKLSIQKRNSAMEECIAVLVLGNNVFTVGKTDNGFASWGVSDHDDSSYWGHYFSTYEEAVADMYERAGVK
jgi:hypothetical protein